MAWAKSADLHYLFGTYRHICWAGAGMQRPDVTGLTVVATTAQVSYKGLVRDLLNPRPVEQQGLEKAF